MCWVTPSFWSCHTETSATEIKRVCVSSVKTVSVCCSRKLKNNYPYSNVLILRDTVSFKVSGTDSGRTISHCGQSLFYCDTGLLAGQCSSHRPTVTSTSHCEQPSTQNLTVLRAERWPENEATCMYTANPCHPHKHYNILRPRWNIRHSNGLRTGWLQPQSVTCSCE